MLRKPNVGSRLRMGVNGTCFTVLMACDVCTKYALCVGPALFAMSVSLWRYMRYLQPNGVAVMERTTRPIRLASKCSMQQIVLKSITSTLPMILNLRQVRSY